MDTKNLIYILLFILVISFFVLGVVIYIYYKSKQDIIIKNKNKKDFIYSIYIILNKNILFRTYFNYIKSKIARISALDPYELNRVTTKNSLILLSITFTLMFISLQLGGSIFYKTTLIIIIIILHNEILDVVIEKTEYQLLRRFEKFIGTVRHFYHEHNMIDEAVYSAVSEVSDTSMEIQGMKMFKVLASEDIETEIEKYYEIVPNKFFKTFMSLAYVTLKFGDKKIDDRSMFLSNLNYLKQEINIELLKREKLNHIFQSLNFIVLLPVFFMKPLESWAITNLPELSIYYNSSFGFIVEMFLLAVIFISYTLIRNMKKTSHSEGEMSKKFYNNLLNVRFINKIVKSIINNNYSKSENTRFLLKQSGVKDSIDVYTLKKLCILTLTLLVSILSVSKMHKLRQQQILGTYDDLITNSSFKSDAEIQLEIMQKELMDIYKDKQSYNDLEEEIRNRMSSATEEEIKEQYEKISTDVEDYQNSYFKWYQLLICIGISYLSTYIPYLIILFKKKMLTMSLEDEVMQFQSIILMLMHMDRIDVLDILEWLEQFSIYFKDSITVTINNYSKGDIEALEQLKIDEPYAPFTRITENLISACNKIPINKAFEELEIERSFFQDKRKQDNEIMINKKEAMGKFIAFIPMTMIMLLFLLLPFMIVSISQLNGFTEQINNIM